MKVTVATSTNPAANGCCVVMPFTEYTSSATGRQDSDVARQPEHTGGNASKASRLIARMDAMPSAPPVVPLGKEGELYVYYSIPQRCVRELKPGEHTRMNLYSMASLADYAGWLEPGLSPDELEQKESCMMKKAGRLLMEMTGGKNFDSSTVCGRGVWRDDKTGGIIYNAGDMCFLVNPDGRMQRVEGVRDGRVYNSGAPLTIPAAEAMTDAEGSRLIRFFQERPWASPFAGELVAGWVACSFLAGVLPYRPHVWINAPSCTGKSALKCDILRALGAYGEDVNSVTGGHAVQKEGAATTAAAIYQEIGRDALPILFDEVESNGRANSAKNLDGLLALMRSSATSGDVGLSKGGANGKVKNYMLHCCFMLFSIANNLDRESDTSRCLVLRMSPYQDDAKRNTAWKAQQETRAQLQHDGFVAHLITRLLQAVPDLLENALTIKKDLMAAGTDVRRAELLGYLLAGAYALKHKGKVTATFMKHAHAVAKSVEGLHERESDMQRCLNALLGYTLPWHGGRICVSRLCDIVRRGGGTDEVKAAACTLESLGLHWHASHDALQIDHEARDIQRIFSGTDWAHGKILPVLGEGTSPRNRNITNELGIYQMSVRTPRGPRKRLMVPAAVVIPRGNINPAR